MRQTSVLSQPRFHPCTMSLCRLLRAPAGRRPFPALSPQSLCRCLDPYPVTPLQCFCSLLPTGQRPHLRGDRFGVHKNISLQCNFNNECFSGLQPFLHVQAPTLARPPGCTYRCTIPAQGSRAVYTTHRSVGYLPRDVVSLRVRHEQLTRQDFHLLDCGLAGRSHLVTLTYLSVRLTPSGHYTSERLTRPYSGELPASAVLSQLTALPGYPILC